MRRDANEMSLEEFRQLKKRKSKYHAKITIYNNIKYASAKEARRAQALDVLKASGEIISWDRQIRIPLHANSKLIGHYVADFFVTDKHNNQWYEDTKGYVTQLAKWKIKQFRLEYPNLELRVL